VSRRLGVDPAAGLSASEAERRAALHGPNEIPSGGRRGPWRLLARQFTDFTILLLFAAAIVAGLVGEPVDSAAILAIVLLNGAIGFVQELRAERAILALRALAAPAASVRRDGRVATVRAAALVPGDVVLLEAGGIVPADLRLAEAARLEIDESALSGESIPAEKTSEPCADAALAVADRRSQAWKGTVVTVGRGIGVVVATGAGTELGKIAALLAEAAAPPTPLQRRLTRVGRRLALVAVALCAVVFALGWLRGEPPLLMFLTAVSLAVAAIPEALPAVVTVSLALGARALARRNALVRRLPAVEALGSVTFICADKTGTLTRNRMQLESLFAAGALRRAEQAPRGGVPFEELYQALALDNDAARDGGNGGGDPTELALARAAEAAGYPSAELNRSYPRLAELPFDSERRCMTTLHAFPEGVRAFTKGAPEAVIGRCTRVLEEAGAIPIDRESLQREADRMAAEGLRVLAVASRRWPALPGDLAAEAIEADLCLLGLVGLLDPPREAARSAVELCRSAGITPVMITGDHPETALAIAARVGIARGRGEAITGAELEGLSPAELAARAAELRVYARVAPEQKLAIVRALQERGEVVAMTGDGVNDAPALRRADIGVAMGRAGTDVAREAAQMILLDDDFATLVAAVREGRRIFANIRKFVRYAITCNSAEIWTLLLAPFLGLPVPLLPIQILWINLVTDGLPGLALAAEPAEPGLMQRPPRPVAESLFAGGLWQHVVFVGLLMAGTALGALVWARGEGSDPWQTQVFTVLALLQLGHVLAIRSETESFFARGAGTNPALLAAVGLGVALQLATVYVPALNPLFGTQPLGALELGVCLALSSTAFVAVELEKLAIRRGWLYRGAARRLRA
jgi:Ca2+-transporting ATPase